MGFLTSIRNNITIFGDVWRTVKSGWESAFLRNQDLSWLSDGPMDKPYTKSDLVYICISTTAKAISQAPLVVYRSVGEDNLEPVESVNPWNLFLDRPNDRLDRYSFVEALVSYLLLDGNAWVISPVPFVPGIPPESVYVIGKKHIKPKKDKDTGALIGWVFSKTGSSFSSRGTFLGTDQVSQMYFWNPYDPIMGMAPLDAGELPVKSDYRAANYNLMFFENGAQPSGVAYTDKRLGDVQFERLKKQMESRHKGYQKAHKLMILEDGLKYAQTSLTQKDMEFYDLRKFDMGRILQIFGMKKSIISETDDLNYATAQSQRKLWWEDTNLPIMRLITSALNFTFFRNTEYVLDFDVSGISALKDSFSELSETVERFWKMGVPFNVLNQRFDLGFPELEGHDVGYLPMSMLPLGTGALPEEESASVRVIEPVSSEPDLIEYVGDGGKSTRNSRAWENYIRRVSPLEVEFESRVKRIFYRMRKRALKNLYKGVGKSALSKSVEDVNAENYEAEAKAIRSNAEIIYRQSILEGISSVIEEIGVEIDLDLSDPVVLNYLQEKTLKVVGIRDTIKRQLRKTLSDGVSEGESIDQLADRVRAVFNASSRRAKTIARTEVVGASNFGRHAAISRSGFRQKEWFTANDERVRPDHQAMHGKKIGTNERWLVGGAYLRYPGDYAGPPEQVINCRCIEVVVPE